MSRCSGVLACCVCILVAGGARGQADSPPADSADAAPAQIGSTQNAEDDQEREEFYDLLMVFADTIDQIDRNYVEKTSRRDLLRAAIRGALTELDPYSNFIAPEELDEFKLEVENEFGGIGIQVTGQGGQLRVISPLVGSPAYRAGIMAGDLILAINGKPTKGLTLSDATKLMKGRAGSSLTLTVFHPYKGEAEDVELQREVIKVDTVLGNQRHADDSWDYMYDRDAKIAYIRISAFSRDTGTDLRRTLDTLVEEEMRGLVLDLRFNPGGLLQAAIEVSDAFLSSGKIVSTEGRNIERQVWNATGDNTFSGFPMAVLVNQYSASASEIVAAALQDHQRAVVIGQQTFGKASVQNVIELEAGRSALKLTTGSYQRPSGKPIHRFPEAEHWGVSPSDGFEVKLTGRDIARLMRERRERDIVPNRQAATDEGDVVEAAAEAESKAKAQGEDVQEVEGQTDGSPFVDEALQMAVAYLRDELAGFLSSS